MTKKADMEIGSLAVALEREHQEIDAGIAAFTAAPGDRSNPHQQRHRKRSAHLVTRFHAATLPPPVRHRAPPWSDRESSEVV